MAKSVLKNYYAPTPQKFRKIGDALLYISLGLQPLTLTLPVSDQAHIWIGFGLSAAGVIAKTITNFFSESPSTEQPQP